MKFIFAVIFYFLCGSLQAQTKLHITGKVVDSTLNPIPALVVKLNITGTLVNFQTISDINGFFSFTDIRNSNFSISISSALFENFTREYSYTATDKIIKLDDIILKPDYKLLKPVEVTVSAITIKEDTIEYKAGLFNVKEDAMVEDILKKLPGIDVGKNGTITAQGKPVYKIKVNGKDFFGSDVKMATRELPANIIDKIQIVDDYGDMAAVSDIKSGEPKKIINLQLKKDKSNGMFGNATAGYGTSNTYLAKLSANLFNDKSRFSVYGNSNNNNNGQVITAKNTVGLMGLTTMGNSRGSSNTKLSDVQNQTSAPEGITTAHSAGVNYNLDFGKENSFSGSYYFRNAGTEGFREQSLQNIYTLDNFLNTRYFDYSRGGNSHQLSLNVELYPDSMSYLKISSDIFINSSNNQNKTDFSTSRNTNKTSDGYFSDTGKSTLPNIGFNLEYNRYFRKKGRNFSFSFFQSSQRLKLNGNNQSFTRFYSNPGIFLDTLINQQVNQTNNENSYSLNLNYSEPINKSSSLDFNYVYNFSKSNNSRTVELYDFRVNEYLLSADLSNAFINTFNSNQFGVNVRTVKKKYNYTIGINLLPVNTKTYSQNADSLNIPQKVLNVAPQARFSYAFSRSKNLSFSYRGYSRQPNFDQLQPTRDIANLQFQREGNPDLKPEFSHNLSTSYNSFSLGTGNTFFSTLNFNTVQNKIIYNQVLLDTNGTQLSRPENLNGYYSLNGFYNFTKGMQKNKYVIKLTGSYSYNHNAILVNSSKVSGNSWFIYQSLEFKYNNSKWLELGIETNYSVSAERSLILKSNNYSYSTWAVSNNMRLDLPGNFIVKYDLEILINNGLDSTINNNLVLLNASIEKKLLKKKSLYLSFAGYNILNQNFSLNRQVSGNSIQDSRSLQLSRYFLFTLTYRWNKFGK